MRSKWVVCAVLAGFSFLFAASTCRAVDTTAVDAVLKKGVLTNQDLQIIDNFLADGITELVRTEEFTDIARLRSVILSRQGTGKQYVQQYSASAVKHLRGGLQAALNLPGEYQAGVTINLLILIDGMADLKLVQLSTAMLASDNPLVRYWAVHGLTNPGIIAKLNAGGAATSQAAGAIAKRLSGLVDKSDSATLALMTRFAGGVKVSQAEELLVNIADVRIRQYMAWKVDYELLDASVLKMLAAKMPSGSARTSAVAYRFGQLYSCAIQRYVVGKAILSKTQRRQLASVLVDVEEKCTSKLLGAPRTTIKRAIERKDDSALTAEHNRLLGTDARAGELAAKISFVYGPDAQGRKRNGPFALPRPPAAE